ncbi:adenylate/guanylate cyclase domain-containing protein [Floridanema evergladense]|uniref:Adenylate/guanylate cyclase domain-containing protein n=1 Tax=Floridaenema evergladense BLCC-F167 TaxID=3153639 RepID=A0ABV4WS45_9CYAN
MVFTDLVNSTAIIKQLCDEDTMARDRTYHETILKPHSQRVETTLEKYRGRKVDTQGDSYFLRFAHPIQAVRWAVEIQTSHSIDPILTPLGPLSVRIGIHIGYPLLEGENLVGYDVHYASRVAAFGNGGQILLSEAMAALVRTASIKGLQLYCHGERDFKGIGNEPIFELLYAGKQPQPLKNEPATIKVAPDTKHNKSQKETQRDTSATEKRLRPLIFRISFLMPFSVVLLLVLVAIPLINPSYISNLCDILPICAENKWEARHYKAENQAKKARELAQEATDYDALKQASDQLEEAINQFESIPPNATIYPTVQKVLPGYKQELTKMKNRLKTDIFKR